MYLLKTYEEKYMQLPDMDEEGYLIDPSTWNEEVANVFATQESIQLTEDHWDAIHFMRQYYSGTPSRTGCSSCNETSVPNDWVLDRAM